MTPHFKTIRDALERMRSTAIQCKCGICFICKKDKVLDAGIAALSQLQKEREELVERLEAIQDAINYHADWQEVPGLVDKIKVMVQALLSTHKQEAKI